MIHNYNNNLRTRENIAVLHHLADLEDEQRGFPSRYVESIPQPYLWDNKSRIYGEIGLGQGNATRDRYASGEFGMRGSAQLHAPRGKGLPVTALDIALKAPRTLINDDPRMRESSQAEQHLTGGKTIKSPIPLHHALKYVIEEMERGAGQNTFMVGKRGENPRPFSTRAGLHGGQMRDVDINTIKVNDDNKVESKNKTLGNVKKVAKKVKKEKKVIEVKIPKSKIKGKFSILNKVI